jgi:geranylgeranyl diphosphate synthase type II
MNSDFEIFLKQTVSQLTRGMPEKLTQSIQYSVLGRGKRIRPRIALATSEMLSLPKEVALQAAVAMELAHAYTLIHDDLPCMDNDDYRRGEPTNHKVYGESTALLAGDALIPMASEALFLTSGSVSAEKLLQAHRILTHALGGLGVIAGQALEEDLKKLSHPKLLERVFTLKTGEFFKASLLIPAALAGLYETKQTAPLQALEKFGVALGIAFQIADDLEDDHISAAQNPAHCLHYWSVAEAKAHALKVLTQAQVPIRSIYGERADGLCRFAEEIQRKLSS